MKTIVATFSVILLLAISATAQPVITAASKIKPGDWYRTQHAYAAITVAGSTGINQTWNYSNLVNQVGAVGYDSAALTGGTPIPPVFAASNLIVYGRSSNGIVTDSVYDFLKVTGDTLRMMGGYLGNSSNTDSYQPPITSFPYYPFTYDTYTLESTAQVSAHSNGNSDTTYYFVDYLVTGYGTLILPGNRTFNNVLQVQRTFYLDDPLLGFPEEIYTMYLTEGIPWPLLEMDTDEYTNEVNLVKYMTSYGSGPVAASFSFTGNGDWSNPANWQGGVMPPANLTSGSSIIINHIPGGSCTINVPYTVSPGVQFIVSPGARLVLPGNLTIQ